MGVAAEGRHRRTVGEKNRGETIHSYLGLSVLLHEMSKMGIDSSLISCTCCLQPRHDIGIKPNRHSGLSGPVKPTDHSIRWNLSNLGDVGQVYFTIRFGSELLKLFAFLSR